MTDPTDVSCFCTRSRRIARRLTETYDAALAPSGLKVTQFSLMRAIRRLDGPTLGDLARATGLDRSTLGRNLRVLARDGMAALAPGEDERTRVVTLTGDGAAALAAAEPLWSQVQAEIEAAVPPADRESLHRIERLLTGATR